MGEGGRRSSWGQGSSEGVWDQRFREGISSRGGRRLESIGRNAPRRRGPLLTRLGQETPSQRPSHGRSHRHRKNGREPSETEGAKDCG